MSSGPGVRFRRILPDPPVFFTRELASTNDALAGWVSRGHAPQRATLLCARQTGGRGRPGHRWISRRGDLTMSRWIPPGEGERIGLAALPLAVAAAVLMTLDLLGFRETLWKYPNDLYALLSQASPDQEAGKLGGFLVEPVRDAAGTPAGWIAGIGLNIRPIPDDPQWGKGLPEMRPVSLAGLPGPEDRVPGPLALAGEISRTLGTLLSSATVGEIRSCLDKRLLWKGRWVAYSLHGQTGMARIEGLEPDGAIRVRGSDGVMHRLGPSTRNLRPVSGGRGQRE